MDGGRSVPTGCEAFRMPQLEACRQRSESSHRAKWPLVLKAAPAPSVTRSKPKTTGFEWVAFESRHRCAPVSRGAGRRQVHRR